VNLLSPQAKITLYIALAVVLYLSGSIEVHLILLVCVMILACRVPFRTLRRGMIPIFFFIAFTFISNVLFQGGEVITRVLGMPVTREGLERGGQLTLRLLILIMGAKVLTATTKADDLVRGIRRLLGPLGRIEFVRELMLTMSLTLRLLPIIYDEALELYRNVRNSDGTTIRGKLRLAVSLISTLFERSLKRAKEMSDMGETL
jgi:energy-coupling factor transport system permease protein